MTEKWLRNRFKNWRRMHGLTLRDVERKTKISNAFLCQFENGAGIGFDKAMKLVRLMDRMDP